MGTGHRFKDVRGAGRLGRGGAVLAGVAGSSALMAPRVASALDFYGHEIPSGDPGVNFVAGLVMGAVTATCVTLAACHVGRGAEVAEDAGACGSGDAEARGSADGGVGTPGAGVSARDGVSSGGASAAGGDVSAGVDGASAGVGTLDVTADLGTLRPRAYARREGGSVYIPDLEELAAAAREARAAGSSGEASPSAEVVASVPADAPAPVAPSAPAVPSTPAESPASAESAVPVGTPAPVVSSASEGPSVAHRRAAHMRASAAPAEGQAARAEGGPTASDGPRARRTVPAPSASRRRGRHFAPGALEAFAGAGDAEAAGVPAMPVIDETMTDAEVSAHIADLVADEMERAREREATPARRKTVRLPSGGSWEHLRVIDGVRVM